MKRVELTSVLFRTEQRLLKTKARAKRWESTEQTRFAYLPEMHVVEVATSERERPMFWVPLADVVEMHPAPVASAPSTTEPREPKRMRVETTGA